MPVRSRPELFAPNALYDTNTARTPKPQQRLLKCLTPSQAYDQSMVIRSKFTTGAWTVRQNPCDANLAESTGRKKSVTGNLISWNTGATSTSAIYTGVTFTSGSAPLGSPLQ